MPLIPIFAWAVILYFLGPDYPVLYQITDWGLFLCRLILVCLAVQLIVIGVVVLVTMRGDPESHRLCKGCDGFRKRINWFDMRRASGDKGVLITCPDCNGEGHVQITSKCSEYMGRVPNWPVN